MKSSRLPLEMVLAACFILTVSAGVSWWLMSGGQDDLLQALPDPINGDGFETSSTCQACHPGPYDGWYRSYHRTMTQAATPGAVLGNFDGVVLEDRGYRWRLEQRGEEFWVEMPDPVWFEEPAWVMQLVDPDWPDQPPRIHARVVLTTGSHHLQNYWIRRPDDIRNPLGPDTGAYIQVPWVWLIDEGRWVPNQDSFLSPPGSQVESPTRWNANCSQCHSVGTQPRASEGFEIFDTRTAELGIACEACHGPGEEHVTAYQSPLRRYLAYFRRLQGWEGRDTTIVNPAKLDADRSLETCGQCHSFGAWRDQNRYRTSGISFHAGEDLEKYRSVFQYTKSPREPLLLEILESDSLGLEHRFWKDGTIRVAGREYNGFIGSSHAENSELTCLSCHSMHEYDEPDSQLDPEIGGNESCLSCHSDFTGAITEHTRHLPESSGSECMNCHMPNTTYGLFSAMRSHRIDSPNLQTSVEAGRPNACNLCHLDETLQWTGVYLDEWYDQPLIEMDSDERSIAASILWALKGDAAQRTILGWHMGWGPAQEASGQDWIAPYLSQLLADPYSVTREVAYRSIVTLPGFRDFKYDYVAPREELEGKVSEAIDRWLGAGGTERREARLLVDAGGEVELQEWSRLFAERDHSPVKIIE